jgi:hypothetical protein
MPVKPCNFRPYIPFREATELAACFELGFAYYHWPNCFLELLIIHLFTRFTLATPAIQFSSAYFYYFSVFII